jgi:uncharacterized OB-fold protein
MAARIVEAGTARILPPLTDVNRPFWTGGRDGVLQIQRCGACERWVHPPVAVCPGCGGPLAYEPVAGTGTVFTFTVNEQPFNPDVPTPYVIAIVELDEQADLRLPTDLVNCEPEAVTIGMRVQVLFEQHGDAFVPLFEPVPGG